MGVRAMGTGRHHRGTRGGRTTQVVLAMVFACSLSVVAAPHTASAGTAPGSGEIEIVIQSPPPTVTDIDVRLLLGGTDVTADRCAPAGADESTQTVRCDGLADGTYAIQLGTLPDGWSTSLWDCAEPIGYSVIAAVPTVGGGPGESYQWRCIVAATAPVISGELQAGGDIRSAGGFGYDFVDPAGNVVPAVCGPELDFGGATPCHFVALGDHTMRLNGVPGGYRTGVDCTPHWLWIPAGQSFDPIPLARVSAAYPWWTCVGFVWPSVSIEAPPSAGITVAGPDGVIGTSCRSVSESTWHCIGLVDGTYQLRATVEGEPWRVTCVIVDLSNPSAPLYIDDPTGAVTVAGREPQQCSVSDEPLVAPTTSVASAGPVGTLPSTGSSSVTTALIALFTTLGGALVLASARRRTTTR